MAETMSDFEEMAKGNQPTSDKARDDKGKFVPKPETKPGGKQSETVEPGSEKPSETPGETTPPETS